MHSCRPVAQAKETGADDSGVEGFYAPGPVPTLRSGAGPPANQNPHVSLRGGVATRRGSLGATVPSSPAAHAVPDPPISPPAPVLVPSITPGTPGSSLPIPSWSDCFTYFWFRLRFFVFFTFCCWLVRCSMDVACLDSASNGNKCGRLGRVGMGTPLRTGQTYAPPT